MSGAAQTSAAPRELVLASAGTGKTFRISSRVIRLLAGGSRPEGIFASTFTRKAAGEILDRVLARLAEAALDERAARELAEHAEVDPGSPVGSTPDGWLRLLRRVVADLHRLNVGTLDAFFVRAATSFSDEVALAAGWGIADAPTEERVRAEVLHRVLDDADAGEMIELVRSLEAGDAARSVHDALLRRAAELLSLHHSLDDAAGGAWASFDGLGGAVPSDLEARRLRLAEAFEAVEPPLTRKGTPNATWVRALRAIAQLLRDGDWDGLIAAGLFQSALREDGSFSRVPVPGEVRTLAESAAGLARAVVARRLSLQCRAMGQLARHLARAVEEVRREVGAYGFDDVTRRLGGEGALCARSDLYYRLDARVQHVLLDEFQDTSLAQWEALRPLLDRQLPGGEGEGAAVVVADPKQSIYGWRGGEPLLVRHVGDRYALAADELSRSWRSSQVVLDVVNRVFEELAGNPVFADDPVARTAAAEWRGDFAHHTAARGLPGLVRVEAGPEDVGPGEDRPLLCRRAAELVAGLRRDAPGRSIGVLTRKNRTVARIMLELRDLGIAASEEGGNPLTDSAAVSAVVSLLRLADHPGDRVARYHVSRTPVGEVAGLRDHEDGASARRVAHGVRRRLLESGYGRTLEEIARRLGGACEPRDRRRLAQLAELGYRYDARATLRTTDFVRVVESERVEDPTAAEVRVMTVHQSKGLEFDIVVLPELDLSLAGGGRGGRPLAFRPHPAGRVARAFPYVGEETRALFPDLPELHAAAEQAAAARWRDAFSGLYVALTRARHALHLLVRPDGVDGDGRPKASTACSAARLVRHALGAGAHAAAGATLFESGDPLWYRAAPADAPASAPEREGDRDAVGPVVLRTTGRRERALSQVSPSSLAGGRKVDLRSLLLLDRRAAERGTLAHAWFEQVGWLEDGAPSDDDLRAVAARVSPTLSGEAVEALLPRFRSWLAAPEIRALLSHARYGPGATVEREVPFFHRADGHLVEGVIDRLVLQRAGGTVVGAEILDYKTDALRRGEAAAIAAKAAYYRPQLEAYRAAVSAWYALPAAKVAARLVFLDAASVVEV